MAVGGHGAQHGKAFAFCRVQINTVEVIAGFFGRDRKAGAVDEAAQVARGQLEGVAEIAARERGEVFHRQAREVEARTARRQGDLAAVAGRGDFDLRAFRQLAHDVIERMGGRGRGAGARNFRRGGFNDLDIHIRGVQGELAIGRVDPDVGKDGDGVAAFDDALHVTQRLQESRALDDEFHVRKIVLF